MGLLELDGEVAPVEVALDDVSVLVAEVPTVLVLDVAANMLDGPVDKEGRAGGQTDAGGADRAVAGHLRGGRDLARREGDVSGGSSKARSEGEDGDDLEAHFDWGYLCV